MRKKMAKLKTGDPAPAFEAVDQDGNMKTLADYRGRKLILYFYPKDNTPGCTAGGRHSLIPSGAYPKTCFVLSSAGKGLMSAYVKREIDGLFAGR